MLRVDHARWGQTPEDLRRLATSAPHRRSRERFLALHEITHACWAADGGTRAGRRAATTAAAPAHAGALPGARRDHAGVLRDACRHAHGPPPADRDGLAARLQ